MPQPEYVTGRQWEEWFHFDPTVPAGLSHSACFDRPRCWQGLDPWYPKEHHFTTREAVREAYDEYWADMRKLAGYFKHVSHLRPS